MPPTLQVYVGGRLIGRLEHGKAHTLRLPACCSLGARPGVGCAPCTADASAALLVLVHEMGRNSAGCAYDFKGLVGRAVTLGGARPCFCWLAEPPLSCVVAMHTLSCPMHHCWRELA